MQHQDLHPLFHAHCDNVRELKRAWRHINRAVNAGVLAGDFEAVSIQTRLLALVYCAYAESVFQKTVSTPGGFTQDQIHQIQAEKNRSIVDGWKKCAQLAFMQVDGQNSGHVPNAIQNLNRLIEEFIKDPSVLRNRLAHGQWRVALNSAGDKINQELTEEIESIDVVVLTRNRDALEKLVNIFEDVIKSPTKTHPRDYWVHITAMEESQRKMAAWTFEQKVEKLLRKKPRSPN